MKDIVKEAKDIIDNADSLSDDELKKRMQDFMEYFIIEYKGDDKETLMGSAFWSDLLVIYTKRFNKELSSEASAS